MTDPFALPRAPDDLGYAGFALDRCGDHRNDPGFLARQTADPARAFALFSGDRLAFRPGADGDAAILFGADEAQAIGAGDPVAFLGRSAAGPVFVARIPEDAEPPSGVDFEGLRALASDGRLTGAPLGLAGCAQSLVSWHARHRFCSNCGAETTSGGSGWRRECASCGTHHFPRVDPVAIMLVTRGDRCLLGRQPRFQPGMWSCLAGFVEPGETVEQAARRETFEEAGITVGRVALAFSQPWPFPAQLMIGVIAEALDEAITIDPVELEEARWFTRAEAASMLAGTHRQGWFAPPPAAIAHHLLKLFAEG